MREAIEGLQRGFVPLGVPDLPVIARLAGRADAQDDAVQQKLPPQTLIFDDAGIGQKFLQVDAHALRVGGVGGAEIDQQHADALRPDVGRGLCSFDGNDRCHDAGGFARCTILVKIMAVSLLSPIARRPGEP
jgi:hypothetical protein